jgi:N-acetyl-anhydromuramyl-L-alanine amidase AmpD
MVIIQKKSPNYGKRISRPDIIVCHITEGSYAGAVSWLCNPDSQVSSHFVISKKGEITQLVPIEMSAWANGTTVLPGSRCYKTSLNPLIKTRSINANDYTISIEHEGVVANGDDKLTEAQLNASVYTICYIINYVRDKYFISIPIDRTHICGHHDVVPLWKTCPGANFPFDKIIKKVGDELDLVTKQKIILDGKERDCEVIQKLDDNSNITNYVKLRDLECDKLNVGYDEVKRMPIVSFK